MKRRACALVRTRVVLVCEPLLLQDALTAMLERLPDIEVIPADSLNADIVLVSASGSNSGWPAEMPPAAERAPRLVALDPIRNMLWVRERRQGRVTEHQVDGHMAAIVDVLLRTPPGSSPPIANAG